MKNSIIKKISVFTLCIVILSGCSKANTKITEKYFEHPLSSKAVVQEAVSYVNQSNSKEKLKDMKKMLENKYLELYLGTNYDIGVYDKRTNEVFLSNPGLYDYTKDEQANLSSESKKILFSQVDVEYFNKAQKQFTLSSYPDSFSENKNQVKVDNKDGKLTVTYGIGVKYNDMGIIPAFTEESYNQYEEKLKGMMDSKKINMIQYRTFTNNYTKMVYSNLSAEDKKTYGDMYPALKKKGILYTLKPNTTNKILNDLLDIYSIMGINKDAVKKEAENVGNVNSNNSPAYFEIPVIYKLQENDLVVSLDIKNIKSAEGYYLTRINLLKSFANSTSDKSGYIFLPDGSGMVINNNNSSSSMDQISIPFYGGDFGKNYSNNSNIDIDSNFPVFGMKSNDCAIFGIVESGEAMGGATGQVKSSYLNYNIVYPYYNYTNYDYFNMQGVSYGFSKKIPTTEYRVRYHFLYGDNATYSGMAKYYQKYLEQMGYLQKRKSNESLPIDINMIGSITKTENKFGVPIDNSYPVTTFENAAAITKNLKDNGVINANVLYSGAINKGMNFIAPKKVSFESELGGLKGFINLASNLKGIGYGLYTDVDFTRIYEKGNGVTSNDAVSKYLSKSSADISSYNPANGKKNKDGVSYIVNPMLYDQIGTSFIKDYKKTNQNDLYLSSIGSILSSNFNTNSELTREESKNLTTQLLQKLKDNGYNMKFDSGNQYVLPFADSLTNIETSSSHRRIESYSVPFVGMVLKGYIPYTAIAINKSGNYDTSVLEAVESGAGLNYLVMYQKQLTLVDTQYKDWFSINYNLLSDKIIKTYKKLNNDLGYLQNTKIVNHERLSDDVACVSYEDGSKIYVNYGEKDFSIGSNKIPAMDYLVVRK